MPRRDPQLSLPLPAPRQWGGQRAGAGRKRTGKPASKPNLAHVSRAPFRKPLPAHVTLRLRTDTPSLRTVKVVHEIERTFARGCVRPGFRLVHYSLQGNHAHLIVEAQDHATLGRGMMAIGSRLVRAVHRIAERSGSVLADRYHVRMLPTPKEVRNALRYVLLNARHHVATATARTRRTPRAVLPTPVRLDPASSARWFDGWKPGRSQEPGPHERPAVAHLRPVARARTWLLAVGWRRYGLLDPADVPG
ncbi:MAG: hypothetical protein ABIR79_18840 [Candidatus Binatia bacterium]